MLGRTAATALAAPEAPSITPAPSADADPIDRNVRGALIGHVVGRSFGLVAFVFGARALTSEELGRYALVTALIDTIRLAFESGIGPATVRRLGMLSRAAWPEPLAAARQIRAVSAMAGIAVALVLTLLPPLAALRADIALASLGIASGLVVSGVVVQLQAAGALHRIPLLHLAGGLVHAILAAGGYLLHASVTGFLVIGLAADLVRIAVGLRLVGAIAPRASTHPADPVELRRLLRHGVPLAAAGSLALVGARMDLWVLGAFDLLRDIATFSIATRVCDALLVLPAATSAALLPVFSAQSNDGRASLVRAIGASIRLNGIVGAAALAVVSLGGGWLLPIVFPSTPDVGRVSALMAVSTLLIFINQPRIDALVALGRSGRVMVITSQALAAVLIADLVLIPRLGALGAAVASTVGHLLGAVLLSRSLSNALSGDQPAPAGLGLPVLSTAIGVAVAVSLPPLVLLPLGCLVLSACAVQAPTEWRALRVAVAADARASMTIPV